VYNGAGTFPCTVQNILGAGRALIPVRVSAIPYRGFRAMPLRIRLLVIALAVTAAALGAARYSGEKGVRPHRWRLAAGVDHACEILDDGTVQCWGFNGAGQLGDGTLTMRTSPVAVSNLGSPAISIAAGGQGTCVIVAASGGVRCWGELTGNGAVGPSSVPVAVTGLVNVISIAVGAGHRCAVRVDGTVWCWGGNPSLQLGVKGITEAYTPIQVPLPNLAPAVSVAAGSQHTCALLANGVVVCWGAWLNTTLPQTVGPMSGIPGVMVVDLAAGDGYTCARLSNGSVSCWGQNGPGRFGVPTPSASLVPVVSGVTPTVAALTGGLEHVCAILADGTVSCWGLNDRGQLGGGGSSSGNGPVTAKGVSGALEIVAGGYFSCALVAGGTIRCWGDNTFGEHGNLTAAPSGTDSVSGINGTFLAAGVTAGNQFTCGRRGNAAPACWGAGTQGQLGNGGNATSLNAVTVNGLSSAVGVSAGNGAHACAVDAQGSVECWGSNTNGQLGNGTIIPANSPAKVVSFNLLPTLYVAVSTGVSHSCALTVTGQVQCWGANDRGQVGVSGGDVHSAVPVAGISNAVAIASGNKFNCALIAGGSVRCWGDNSSKQLGDGGTEAFSYTPAAVGGLANITAIAAGRDHVCALSGAGTVLCWGSNSRGQLGNNSTQTAAFPTTVQGLNDMVAIAGGAYFSCAVHANTTASCWGANDSGELAAIDSASHLTPTLVVKSIFQLPTGGFSALSLGNIVSISTGTNSALPTQEQACAVLATGIVECWGHNGQGEIGDGTTTNRPRPTVVNSFAANVDSAVTLRNGRIAEVTALINCDAGAEAHLVLTLDQGVTGTAHAVTQCEGRLQRVPMNVPAQGASGFVPGGATAQVEAIVQSQGETLEDTHWTKAVVLSLPDKP
jgi:alpha-tubulin suppressor-like RCC1 family protein